MKTSTSSFSAQNPPLSDVWAVELDLLQHLLDVCRRHGLRVWADGGTLLGAVRHQGFIPWDDDIDLCMPRPDYDRLIGLGATEFREPYFLQSAYSEADYFRGHAQLRRSDTAAIRPSESYRTFNQGIFIDIFPLDGLPADADECRRRVAAVHHTHKLLKAARLNLLYSGRWAQVFRKLWVRWLISRHGRVALFAKTEELLRQTPVDTATHWAELAFSGTDIVLRHEVFADTRLLPFEHLQAPVPVGYDELLRTQYGPDYMTPRRDPSYHGELVFSTTRSYRDVAPEVYARYKHSALHRLVGKMKGKG